MLGEMETEVALVVCHCRVADWPAVIEVGFAEKVIVGGGSPPLASDPLQPAREKTMRLATRKIRPTRRRFMDYTGASSKPNMIASREASGCQGRMCRATCPTEAYRTGSKVAATFCARPALSFNDLHAQSYCRWVSAYLS